METSSVLLEHRCGCSKWHCYKIRFYSERVGVNTSFNDLPAYDGIADLTVTNDTAHISAFVMRGYSRFRRMHDYDLEQMIRHTFPSVKSYNWERHKGGEVVKFVRELV